jgi:ABC-2 type transport system ATP-binding protein
MTQAVILKDLCKSFTFTSKDPTRSFISNLVAPQRKTIQAVDNISLSIAKGETVAFIGPNGAGKSTTIKMLSGILYPTSGDLRVLGLNPQRERRQLAYKIGTVFGQRSQLIFNLPVTDSMELFAKIYEIPTELFTVRQAQLIELFNLTEILTQPVRKLSLGQRMRAEIACALLHEPEIVFLDEPTIGLDIVAKRKLRENLRRINQELGTTIFLTSHDAGDVEYICDRTIIINAGKVAFDGMTNILKKRYLTYKIVQIDYDDTLLGHTIKIDGVTVENSNEHQLTLVVDTNRVGIDVVLKEVVAGRDIADISIYDPPLEEIIEKVYKESEHD